MTLETVSGKEEVKPRWAGEFSWFYRVC